MYKIEGFVNGRHLEAMVGHDNVIIVHGYVKFERQALA